ncbi:MAG TPA: UDP-N-acetylglucosamine 1-carboxyvinyltransferase [Azospirillaceae bacterium]|nr:UDP-N-acetylglucosamine 1-carboxyvinyltransferase [Azospirillaceae bacterium]
MDKIRIRGGRTLNGTIPIAGAKNAALPLMCASILTDKPLRLANVPDLADIRMLEQLLAQHGVFIGRDGETGEMVMTAARITSTEAPYDIVRKMRASVLVLGPLLARCGRARVSQPGGCAIGTRPVDIHLKGLQALGADVDLNEGYIEASAPRGLTGGEVKFPFPSVGATENIMMAAALARGETVIENAAREPEIVDLADCLNAMGAHVEGAGSGRIVIQGKDRLSGASHRVLADRIETGTYLMAAAVTGGEVELTGTSIGLLSAAIEKLREAGVVVSETRDGIRVHRRNTPLQGIDVVTEPHPGFPTDLQAQLMGMLTVAEGASMITENIFENRFMHVPELCRLGADINVQGASAVVRGVPKLTGAPVMATDLRASVSLVIAALAAEGETEINRVYHLDRGYERLEAKLQACGADVERVPG